MSFLPAGYSVMAVSGASALVVLALAVWRRNWGLWLIGIALFALAVCVAFAFRATVTPSMVPS